MLKKIICTLAAVGFLATSVSSFGVSRASLFLVGQVDVIVNLFVNPVLGGIDTLDVEAGETLRLVATVDEETNNAADIELIWSLLTQETFNIMMGQQTFLIRFLTMVQLQLQYLL